MTTGRRGAWAQGRVVPSDSLLAELRETAAYYRGHETPAERALTAAADEIERLQTELEDWKRTVRAHDWPYQTDGVSAEEA